MKSLLAPAILLFALMGETCLFLKKQIIDYNRPTPAYPSPFGRLVPVSLLENETSSVISLSPSLHSKAQESIKTAVK